MKKYYRKKKEDYYDMYYVCLKVTISSSSQMRIESLDDPNGYLDTYDEESGRWFCKLGCGFRYHKDAYDVLSESAAIVSK